MSSPTHYEIRDWRNHQHYKDRNPPWIKLHYSILTSPEWVVLADASKALAIACMLVASKNDGIVPNDPAYIKRLCYLNACNLKPLVECGLLVPLADAGKCEQVLARSVICSLPSEETEDIEQMPYGDIVDILNREAGTAYRPSSAATRRLIAARLKDGFTVADFAAVIASKVADWRSDPAMSKYLRPETLFGTKFESYLQAAKAAPPRPREPFDPGPEFWAADCLRIQQEEEQKRAKMAQKGGGNG